MFNQLIQQLNQLKNPSQAKRLQSFFKSAPGQYAAGDIFLGITMPQQRQVAKKYPQLKFTDLQKLLASPIHEYRLTALLILIQQYQKANLISKKKIYHFYLKNIKHINNWDLVDLSAPKIIGHYLLTHNKSILYKLVASKNLWERRIAIVATLEFINHQQFTPTLKIAKNLINDQHDLIHKAVGWMLREVGKHDQKLLEKFLTTHLHQLPRTTLRYAIEKFPEQKRQLYLQL